MGENASNLLYLVTIVTFILACGSSRRRGARGSATGWARPGMALAIVVTLAREGLEGYGLMAIAMAIGAVGGAVGARRVKMTAMPQMVALFNGVGGGAAALIALAEFHNLAPEPGRIGFDETVAILLSALIGSVSFSGSLVAFAKLQELVSGRPIVYPGQKVGNSLLLGARRRARGGDPLRAAGAVAARARAGGRAASSASSSSCRSAARTCRS